MHNILIYGYNVYMSKDHESLSKREEIKSSYRQSIIEQRKHTAVKEMELFNAFFDVNRFTGLEGIAEELWKAYFAAGLMRKTAHVKEISETELIVASRIPILGFVYRYIHFFGQCGDAAWSELNERAKEIEFEFKRWVEIQIVTLIGLQEMSREKVDMLIHNESAVQEYIDQLKRQGQWEDALSNVERAFGTISSIKASANLISTIYVQAENKRSQVLWDHITNAGEKYIPPAVLEKRKRTKISP